ncbi:hypothetical protein CMUS01_05426 [Colletotrichum musicola]|uniref:Uncharacterized protein n=1 Tax=Colletotrichum musicola TaxID=2175873 RepID=A0A8H6KRF6_9PEZI|nr:hypothetical protein CMUS01_05426 [Colletotrichum musicola]
MQPSCLRPRFEVRNLKPCRRRHQPAVLIGEGRDEAGNGRDTTEGARGQLGLIVGGELVQVIERTPNRRELRVKAGSDNSSRTSSRTLQAGEISLVLGASGDALPADRSSMGRWTGSAVLVGRLTTGFQLPSGSGPRRGRGGDCESLDSAHVLALESRAASAQKRTGPPQICDAGDTQTNCTQALASRRYRPNAPAVTQSRVVLATGPGKLVGMGIERLAGDIPTKARRISEVRRLKSRLRGFGVPIRLSLATTSYWRPWAGTPTAPAQAAGLPKIRRAEITS